MSDKKKALGRGLDALFADNMSSDSENVMTLKISEIEPNRNQPRKTFNDHQLAELADSIRIHGVIQPLLVRPMPSGEYRIVAGERRWRASRMVGLTEVPVVIREMSDQEADELALIENLQREDLNSVEEAKGYDALMKIHSMTQDEVAKSVGKSRSNVANSLRLLNLPNEVLELLKHNTISAGHARALLGFNEKDDMIKTAKLIVEKKLSVREVEKIVNNSKKEPKNQKIKFQHEKPIFAEIQLSMENILAREVVVTEKNGRGKLEMEFFDLEDLKKLAETICNNYE